MTFLKSKVLILVLISLSFTFADNSSRNVVYGNGRISSHPDSLYFHFASGTVRGNPTGMDVMITGNEGTNFGNEGGFYGTVPFADPSDLFYYAVDGSLENVSEVPTVDDPDVNWTTVSWDWLGGNGGQPLTVGNVWVVFTRTTQSYAVLEITQVNPWSNNGFSFNYMYQTDGSVGFGDDPDPCDEVICDNGLVCDNGECVDAPGMIFGSATMSAHPDSIYFNFETGTNGSDTTGMDVMISGNEGTNFGSESAYFSDGMNWNFYSGFNNPSPIYYLSPDSSLATITSVPMVDENWPTISWSWPNGNGGQPLAVGNVWVVYCRTTQSYAVLEVTYVTNSWDYPRFSFNYYFQPDGSTSFDGDGEVSGCTNPEALNYNPNATIDDGSCYYFVDCNGDPDGEAFIDDCGECVGGYTELAPEWAADDCGICFGDNSDMDCNGDCFGSAFWDECQSCVGGNTGLLPGYEMDDCGQCYGNNGSMDCAGTCFGNAYVDACGECDEDPNNDCEPALIYGSATMSAHPDSIYFNFEFGINGTDTTGMDVMISGNEGTNFGSESAYFSDGMNWNFYSGFNNPSPIYYLSPDSSLATITSVPAVDETWPTISWSWPNGNGGQPLAVGNVWVVYCRTAQNYAVLEVTSVSNSWDYPRFSFNYYYQPDGSTSFDGNGEGDISGCTDPEAINYDPDATIDDGSCEYYNLDCNGDLGGQAFIDECGECVGGNTELQPGWAMDDCGVCFGENQDMDCNGDCFGSAFWDECQSCVSGNTGLLPGYEMDDCGQCYGNNNDMDCAGVCFGDSYVDGCGVCDDNPDNDCVETQDCDGVIGSGAYLDDCGICVGGMTGLEPSEFCSAQIISIWDVPADQGGRVYVEFQRAASDMNSSRTTEGYTIERLDPIDGEFLWVAVASGYAYYQDIYTYEVSTLQDSSDTSYGLADFRIISGMDEGTWISDPASGYSVDNIAPSAPTQLLASFIPGSVGLEWNSSMATDFQYYTIYRNDESVGYVTENAFDDITFEYGIELEYLVTATDSNGNESQPSNIQTVFGGASGDINGDAVLNVSDLVLLIDMILNGGYDEYQTWAGDLNEDGIINVLDVVFIVNVILNGELSRGDSLNEAQVSFGNGELKISGDGNLAGIEIQLTGNYQLNPMNLPPGWQLHHQNGLLLLFDAMGSALINELVISYSGDLSVETALAADGHGNGIMADIEIIPQQFRFNAAYPNPFNPVTNFEYELSENSHVEIIVYDMLGTQISELRNEHQSAGIYQMTWNAGSSPTGVYFIKLKAGNEISFQKVLLVK